MKDVYIRIDIRDGKYYFIIEYDGGRKISRNGYKTEAEAKAAASTMAEFFNIRRKINHV